MTNNTLLLRHVFELAKTERGRQVLMEVFNETYEQRVNKLTQQLEELRNAPYS